MNEEDLKNLEEKLKSLEKKISDLTKIVIEESTSKKEKERLIDEVE